MTVFRVLRDFCRKAALFQEFRQHVRDFVQILFFYFAAVLALFNVANRHRNHNAVSNQVAKVQLALDFGFCRELPVFFVVAVNVFKDVTIEFFFGANQRLNATLESKSQERVFPRHELVEFLDPLRLRSQKVIVLQQFNNLNQKIRMRKVDTVARFLRTVPEVVRILVQNFQHRVSGIQVVVQRNHIKSCAP